MRQALSVQATRRQRRVTVVLLAHPSPPGHPRNSQAGGRDHVAGAVTLPPQGVHRYSCSPSARLFDCLMIDDATLFQSIVDAVNVEALAKTGIRSTCVLSAYALARLGRLGYRAYPLRVEVAIHNRTGPTPCGTLLGRDPWERPAAEPGAWHGHLVAAVDEMAARSNFGPSQ